MPSLLQRLYRTKLALIATLSTTAGLGLLGAMQWSSWAWLENPLVGAIGSTFFGTGMISIILEAFISREADQLSEARIRKVIRAESSTLRDSVLDGLATQPQLARIASTDTLDRIIDNAMTARFRHAKKATDIYASIKRQVLNATQTRRDSHAFITLTPWESGPASGLGAMFVATIRWQYLTYDLPETLRFSAVSDQQRYRELLRNPESIETWWVEPAYGLTIANPETYSLLECTIDGRPTTINHLESDDAQLFTVVNDHSGHSADGTYVTYTHRTLVRQSGHRLFIDFPATDGLRVDFTYSADCGIHQVGVVDYNSSGERARVYRSHKLVTNPTISLDLEGWIFPHSGAVFTWLLDREVRN
jgi:hypothetical protein